MRELVCVWWCRVSLVLGLLLVGGCSPSDPAPSAPAGCTTDNDCKNGFCSAEHECSQCRFDSHCAETQRCDLGQCLTRVSCVSAADCKSAAAPACDSQRRECFACVSASDCGADETCNVAHHCVEKVRCTSAADCATGLCFRGECADCSDDRDCAANERCSQNRCAPPCASDNDCAAQGLLCDPRNQACVECVVSDDCPSNYYCGASRCVPRACQPGSSKCASSSAAAVCSPDGDRFITLFCAAGQACTDQGSGVRCSNWRCTPGVSQCNADGARVEQCNTDGLSSTVTETCGPEQLCQNARCVNLTCTAGEKFCKAGAIYQCGSNGTSASVVQQCAGTSYCDPSTVSCALQVCTPGQVSCTGQGKQQHRLCKGDGSGYEDVTDCADGELCSGGTCVPMGCTANSSFCDGQGKVRSCNAAGTASTVSQNCNATEYCVESGASASCSDKPCTPNQPACSGNSLVSCNADGTGYVGNAVDCGLTGSAVCKAGACVAKQCESGELSCNSGSLYLCTNNSQQLYQACTDSQYCDPAAKSCKPRVCQPSVAGCNGQTAATCNADGSGYLSTGAVDCAASSKVCSAGVCTVPSCTANQTYCQAGNVYKCNAAGSGSTLTVDCYDPSQHCVQFSTSAECALDVCSDNTQACSGNALVKCNADGSGYASTTDCGAQVCVSGACLPKLCVPGSFECSGNVSTVCNSTGTAYVTNQTCSSGTFCSAGKCVPLLCAPGAAACVANSYGVCNATGSAQAAGGINCLSSGQVCNLTGCVDTATDALSESSSTLYFSGNGGNVLVGAAIRISSNRILTSIQANFYAGAVGTLRLLGYVSDTQAGPYLPLFDTSVQIGKGTGGVTESAPLSVPLSAGKFYYFAEHFPSPTFYGDQANTARFLGVGRLVGSYSSTNISQPPQSITVSTTGFVPDIRLVTKAP